MEFVKVMVFDLATEGLEPLKHRIIGITIKTATEEKIITNRDEKTLLEDFYKYLKTNNFDKIIGFNSESFDIPVLTIMSIKHKVTMPNLKGKMIDLRNALAGDRKGTLEDFQQLLGITFFDSRYKKMHMSLLWEANKLPKLEEFLLRDAKVTWQLYEHVKEAGLI